MLANNCQQDCIPVGCVPPACCPYLPACTALCWGGGEGGCLVPGVSGPGGCLPLVWGGVSQYAMGQTPPPVNRITDTCKSITGNKPIEISYLFTINRILSVLPSLLDPGLCSQFHKLFWLARNPTLFLRRVTKISQLIFPELYSVESTESIQILEDYF